MVHAVSNKGIVGLGALGQAIDGFIPATENPAAVLFAVKAFDLEYALLEQGDQWPEKTPFVTLCNGYIWPVIEKVYPRLGRRPIRIGMTTIGSTITSDGSLRVFSANTLTAWGHWPDSKVPSIPPDKPEIHLLKRFPGGLWHEDVRPTIRVKWILNVVINSVVAAYRLKQNGLLNDHQRDVEEALVEAIDLAQKLWSDLPFKTSQKAHIAALLWQVVDATSGNENSMVRDVSLGRQTESEYLAGMARHYDGFPVLKRLHKSIVG
jgi:ketopantoate reductase